MQAQGTNIALPPVKVEVSNDDIIKKFKQLSMENASAIKTTIESTQSNPAQHSLIDTNDNHDDTNVSHYPISILLSTS